MGKHGSCFAQHGICAARVRSDAFVPFLCNNSSGSSCISSWNQFGKAGRSVHEIPDRSMLLIRCAVYASVSVSLSMDNTENP
jgi:hypothetical protein